MKAIRYALIGATAAVALAGCGKKESTTVTTSANGSVVTESTTSTAPATTARPGTGAQPAAGSAASLGLQPGKWETTVEITDVKITGGPAGMPAMPKPAPQTRTNCLTAEQANKGPAELLKDVRANCAATRNVYGGGKIDVAMTCNMPTATMTTKTTGTYTPTSMTSDAEVQVNGRMQMTEKVHATAKRIGECTG